MKSGALLPSNLPCVINRLIYHRAAMRLPIRINRGNNAVFVSVDLRPCMGNGKSLVKCTSSQSRSLIFFSQVNQFPHYPGFTLSVNGRFRSFAFRG